MRNSWNDHNEFMNLYKFGGELLLKECFFSKMIGVKLLNLLTQEMQRNIDKPLVQHPRNSEKFRKDILPLIFSMSFDHLTLLLQNPCISELLQRSIELMCTILSFDFMEDSDEFIVNLPGETPQAGTLKNPIFVNKIFQLYEFLVSNRCTDSARLCLKLLSLMVSINLRHFVSDTEKISFLTEIVKGAKIILDSQLGMDEEGCRHDFSMLISRIGTSSAVYELREFTDIGEFVKKVYEYSVSCIKLQDFNLMHYILKFWLKLSFKLIHFSELKEVLICYIRSLSELVICILVTEEEHENIQSILDILWGMIKVDYITIGTACVEQFKIGVQKAMTGEGSIYGLSVMILIFNTFMIENKKIYAKMPVPLVASQGAPSSTEVTTEEQLLNASITTVVLQLQSLLLTDQNLNNEDLKISCLTFLKSFVAKYFKLNVGNHVKVSYGYIASYLGLETDQDLLREIMKILFTYMNSSTSEELHCICAEILNSLVLGSRKVRTEAGFIIECGKMEFKLEYIQEIFHRFISKEYVYQNNEFRIKPRIKFMSGIMGLFSIVRDM